mgnify:CR=1 FL=1
MPSKTAERLVALRGKDSQQAIARIAGCSPATISNWENDVHSPPADALARLAVHWGVSADYLVGLSDFPSGLAPDSWIVDLDAYEKEHPGSAWAAKVPRRHKIVDYAELQRMESKAQEERGPKRGRGGQHGSA